MPSLTIKGNDTGSTSNPLDLTVAQVNAILPIFTSTLNGLAPFSGGGSTNFLRADGSWALPPGAGSVTSVGLGDASSSPIYNITNSPVTTSGTLTLTLKTQSANKIFAGPTTGASAQPTFRSLVGADLPNPSATTLGGIESYAAVTNQFINAISTSGVPSSAQPAFTNISGTATIAQGGTGQTTATAAFSALSPISTTGDIIYSSSGTTNSRLAIGSTGNVLTVAGGVPSWAAPATSGTVTSVGMTVPTFLSVSPSTITSSGTFAVTLSGTALPIANGGTGQTTASTAFNALSPITTTGDLIYSASGATNSRLAIGSTNQVLTVVGGVPTWGTLSIAGGGTGQTTANAAFNALSPMTTGGDLIYGGASGAATRLANGTAGQILQSNGTTLAPTWVAQPTTSPLTTKGDTYIYSTTNARLPVGSDGQHIIADSNNTNGVRYQDQFPKNYIVNSDAEVDTSTWSTYSNTAKNIPVNGTGGTATGLTFSRSTSSPLFGTASFSMVQTNSTNIQGKGVSIPITIDAGNQAKPLAIQFSYNASSTFVTGNGVTAPLNDGTTSTNAGNSDIEVFIYDVTNSQLIYVSPQVMVANGANNFQFKGTFQTNSNSTSYRLILHVATANANATGWTYKFDQVFVGALPVCYGAAVTDWVSYTPTLFGGTNGSTFTNNTTNGEWRRVGSNLEISIRTNFTGAPGTGTGGFSWTLPTGLVIDTARLPLVSNTFAALGNGNFAKNSTTNAHTIITPMYTPFDTTINQTTSVVCYYQGGITLLSPTNLVTVASGDDIAFTATVPIVGWSSTTVMSNDTDTRVVAARATSSTTTIFAGGTDTTVINPTIDFDTHGAYNASTGIYTIPVSGKYQINAAFEGGAQIASGGPVDRFFIKIKQNSTIKSSVVPTIAWTNVNSIPYALIADVVNCIAGDTIQIIGNNGWNASSTLSGTASTNYFSINRLSGPAAIAATESVNARYHSSTSTVGTSSSLITIYSNKDFDSHNAYSTSTGLYTIPTSGKYQVSAALVILGTFTSGNSTNIYIYKNGAEYTRFDNRGAGDAAAKNVLLTDIVFCNAGDTIGIYQDSGGTSPTLGSSISQNFISISRVGN